MGQNIKKIEVANISDIVDTVSQGKCILFLGAGVHYSPPKNSKYKYPEADRPPLGSRLAETLSKESKFLENFPEESPKNLQRAALHFEIVKGRKSLVDRVIKAVHFNKKPSPVLRALAELNFPLVGMTNYDRLFEKALNSLDKDPVLSIYNKNRNLETFDYSAELDPNRPFIFKIHGDINRPNSIVITEEDYIDFLLRMSDKGIYNPVPDTFRYYFKLWPTLFIGYSLLDYNLRLLFKTLRWIGDQVNIPRSYSVDLYPDNLIYKIYSERTDFVQFIVQDVWTFVPELYHRIKKRKMPL